MRICLATLAVGILALATAASASAAALDARDFSVAVPADQRDAQLGERAASARTRTITISPRRPFDLVGFRWRGSGTPKIMVQSEGPRGWSDWEQPEMSGIDGPDPHSRVDRAAVKSSEPVWTGYSRRIRVKVSGRGFSSLRAHFVRVTGTAVPRSIRTSAGAATPGSGGEGNRANVEAPAIVRRKQWDPRNRCKPKGRPAFGEVLSTVVHHTVSTNSYSRGRSASVVLGICRYHRYSRKWNDVGYNLLIDRYGTVFEGRAGGVDKAVIGAHAQGYNGQTSGISLIGSFMSTSPPAATLDSLRRVLQWKLALAQVSRNERVALISTGGSSNRFKNGSLVFARPVAGHRDLDFTDCPGNNLYARLNEIQSFLTGEARQVVRLTARLRRVRQGDGQAVQVTGRMTAAGKPVANKPVALEVFNRRGWKAIGETTTDAAGIWRVVVAPKNRYYMRGHFTGDDALRSVRSRWKYSPKIRRAKSPGASRR
ncbi:MAG: N-acetylmuramoyl-L-alanine amidase [Solirubrobacterales bacterium]